MYTEGKRETPSLLLISWGCAQYTHASHKNDEAVFLSCLEQMWGV